MKKQTYPLRRTRVRELESFDRRKVDFGRFKPDVSPAQEAKMLQASALSAVLTPVFLFQIESLSPSKTVGRGRTNLTIIRPTIVQTDAATPYAGFDRTQSPARNPAIQMHFEPAAYGFTTIGSFIMVFDIETVGSCTFNLAGFAGSTGTLPNAGTRVLNGRFNVSLNFRNVPANQQTFGFIEQTAGNRWNCFSVRMRLPFPVATRG